MTNAAFVNRALQPGFDPYAGHGDTGWFGSKLAKSVAKAAKSVAKTVEHAASGPVAMVVAGPAALGTKMAARFVQTTNVKQLVPQVTGALKNAGPIGMVAAGSLAAMQAGLSGKKLEDIAWAAAEGAAPEGISHALSVAEKIRHGGSIIDAAVKEAQSRFLPNTPEILGFNSAIAALKTQASKAGLGEVRRALSTEGSRRAFDAAIGVVSKTAKGSTLVKRAGGIRDIALNASRGKVVSMPVNLKGAVDALKRNPALMSVDPMVLANRLKTNRATINDAMKHVGSIQLLPWRSLSPRAIAFIRKHNPQAPLIALRHAHTDTAGLDQSGMKYIVEKGDGPWAIAQKLTGNGNRWKELLDVNKDKNPKVDKNVWVGEVLNLPLSWQKPVAAAKPPTVALPAVPLPTIAPVPTASSPAVTPSIDVTPSIIQAKAILVAWGKTDGVNQAGVSDYGLNVADLSTTMGPRDTLELSSFQNWNNKTLPGANLKTDGTLDAATLSALQAWAEARATAALPAGVPSVPGLPAPTPVVIPAVVGGTDSSATPVVTSPGVPKVQAQASGGTMGPIALGAVVGGLLFGVPGAVIGAAGGAAIS